MFILYYGSFYNNGDVYYIIITLVLFQFNYGKYPSECCIFASEYAGRGPRFLLSVSGILLDTSSPSSLLLSFPTSLFTIRNEVFSLAAYELGLTSFKK